MDKLPIVEMKQKLNEFISPLIDQLSDKSLEIVTTSKDIEKIQNEISALSESFRKAVSFMEVHVRLMTTMATRVSRV